MPKAANKPNAEQAKEFDQWMRRWQAALNLGDWRIEAGKRPASKGAMADVHCDPAARLATYRLGDWGGEEINTKSLRETALHESLHILFHDLIDAAQDRNADPEKLEAAEHRVINVLERLLTGGHNARS